MKKKRILFVDDEPNILAGMNRMLRPLRKGMDIDFTESGNEALELMARKPYDIVVSDMRMPGMDGATMLTRIRDEYPDTIRIILSGQADNEAILRTVGVAHQFLAKPCEPERLKLTLHRACQVHEALHREDMREIVARITSLPSLPRLYNEIQLLLSNPATSVEQVADCIAQDIAMSSKVLQLVNSAFFGLYQEVDSPEQAVHLLGLDTIKTLVLGLEIFSQFEDVGSKFFSLDVLWQHSLRVGAAAKAIAESQTDDKHLINCAFIAGLQHDIGQLVLWDNLPQEFDTVCAQAVEEDICLYQAELDSMQVTHAEIGAYLLGLWGFASEVIEAVAFHHFPGKYAGKDFSVLTAVHVANGLAPQGARAGKRSEVNKDYLARIGCLDKLAAWEEISAKLEAK